MLRRRYRLFTICAVVIIFMLYRVLQNSWDDPSHYTPKSVTSLNHDDNSRTANGPPRKEEPPRVPPGEHHKESEPEPKPELKPDRIAGQEKASENDQVGVKIPTLKDPNGKDESKPPTKTIAAPKDGKNTQLTTTMPTTGNKGPTEDYESGNEHQDKDKGEYVEVHWKHPPKGSPSKQTATATQIHWAPVQEHFPVPTESLITLPTGKPQQIPKIQHEFGVESPEAKTKRIQRQERVKKEIGRAWSAYRKFGWMHDELSPVSSKYRDPFCGWAATLVDSLDTLWIAGLKEEFDEAAKAVKDIDFTFTPRSSIPVFETTIRYLGGLLGAFDVSGGHDGGYTMLLTKAVELADILMGIFDTPNRMPILYYQWKPEYASQPHRASVVGIAELATLSLEFTRLAQLTNKNKYYDAVARITDALVQMQKDGTAIPGLFPESLDASGCNQTATSLRDSISKEAQEQLDSKELSDEPKGYVATRNPKNGSDSSKEARRSQSDFAARRRDTTPSKGEDTGGVNNIPGQGTPKRGPPFAADGSTSNWDCVPQGLVANGFGYQTFHMGGAQDSAYEYFPKEYLLLGGLEFKYKKLHVDTIEAMNEWLLYRPMTKGDWDILFSAKVSTRGDPHKDLDATFEVTHLTCFIGGMYGLGGKIFGREKDVETAKKLTDGCVWAYQATSSGVMPEGAEVLPCPTLEKCAFNETLWWETLDPAKEWRVKETKEWEETKRKLEKTQVKAQQVDGSRTAEANGDNATHGAAETLKQTAREYSGSESEKDSSSSLLAANATSESSKSVHKRAVIPEGQKKDSASEGADNGSGLPQSLKDKIGLKNDDQGSKKKGEPTDSKNSEESKEINNGDKDVEVTKESTDKKESKGASGGSSSDASSLRGPDSVDSVLEANRLPLTQVTLPPKPISHEEFVKSKIETSGLPPGFVAIPSKQYILRPEAIESVWYMYRITGDPSWMEKGWTMFEATIRATRTEIAHSAFDDVTKSQPGHKDEMESFWLAETLKYYYLLFSEPSVISLDEWVLNTEAHPFRRPGSR